MNTNAQDTIYYVRSLAIERGIHRSVVPEWLQWPSLISYVYYAPPSTYTFLISLLFDTQITEK